MSVLACALGALWGLLAAVPFAARADRLVVLDRLDVVADGERRVGPGVRGAARLGRAIRGTGMPALVERWRRTRAAARAARQLAREVAVAADVLGVAVSAGCTPFLAVEHAARWGPPLVAAHLREAVDAVELGAGFTESLAALADRVPVLAELGGAIVLATQVGHPLGPALSRIADDSRRAARRAAEEHARKASVRLLFPLVLLVLPAFVLLAVVPGIAAGLGHP